MTFPLSVLTIDRTVFDGQAKAVTLPGMAGEFQVLADHAPLIAKLKEGNVVIEKEDSSSEILPIAGGTVEVTKKEVVVLADF